MTATLERPSAPDAYVAVSPGPWQVIRDLVILKAMLLRGTYRRSNVEAFGLVLAFAAGAFGGGSLAFFTTVAGRHNPDNARPVVMVVMALIPVVAIVFGAVLGSEGSVDPRKVSPLPIRPSYVGMGALAAGAVGVGGLAFGLMGMGVILGFASGAVGTVVSVVAVAAELVVILVLSRTVSNLLGVMASGRLERFANVIVALTGLTTAALAQGVAAVVTKPIAWWQDVFASISWMPTARLASAATGSPGGNVLIDLVIGLAFLASLIALHSWTFSRFLVILPGGASSNGGVRQRRSKALKSGVTRFDSPVGSVVRRTMRAKFRSPRQLTNLIAAVGLGLGGVVGLAVFSARPMPPTTVLLGGAVQFLVLFDNQNCLGMDGRALGLELMVTAPSTVIRGKRIAAILTGLGPMLLVPVALAAYSGGWVFVPIAWILGAGSVLASSGLAVLLGTLAPVGIPETANPFASADAGQGCLASVGFILSTGLLGLMTAPVTWALMRYADTNLAFAWEIAGVTLGVSALLGHFAEKAATAWVAGHVPELFAAVSPRD